jgi:hypothetical protein
MNDASRIRRRRWTPAEDNTIRQLYGTTSAAEIASRIDRTADAVWIRAVRTLGLDKRGEVRPWSQDELDYLADNYPHGTPSEIAEHLTRSPSAVYQQARAIGLEGRKAAIIAATVHDYFARVTTAEQAYVLGLLAADGNVASDHPRVMFGLQAKDRALVEWVRDRLNPKTTISAASRDGFAAIQVTSRQMVDDLASWGIVPRKSRTLPWPRQLGEELLRPYLLGYFDGDGCMYVRWRNGLPYAGWNVCSGSEQFLVDMKEYVREAARVTLQKIHHRAGADLWQVSVTGRAAAALYEWMHQDGLGLARKRLPADVAAWYR